MTKETWVVIKVYALLVVLGLAEALLLWAIYTSS
jgi:hypothetical protein